LKVKTKPSFAIDSFESYISTLKEKMNSLDDEFVYYYRGCCTHDWEYNLTPGVYRYKHIQNEDRHFREMILQTPNEFLNERTTLEKMVKMQHYRLPTRLLDITSNPLVALYFACSTYGSTPMNGKVYVLKIRRTDIKYYDSDAVSLVSNLAKLSIDKTNFMKKLTYLIHEVRDEKPQYIDTLKKENKIDIKRVFTVKAKLNNDRIIRQSGAFLLFGVGDLKSKEKAAILSRGSIEDEIIIGDWAKKEILTVLDALSINERTMFPELEYQAKYLDGI